MVRRPKCKHIFCVSMRIESFTIPLEKHTSIFSLGACMRLGSSERTSSTLKWCCTLELYKQFILQMSLSHTHTNTSKMPMINENEFESVTPTNMSQEYYELLVLFVSCTFNANIMHNCGYSSKCNRHRFMVELWNYEFGIFAAIFFRLLHF